jgi:stage II sporulation protein Q
MGKYTKYLMPTLYLGVIAVMIFSVVLIISGVKNYISDSNNKFTLDNVFEGEILPVTKIESNIIVKPFISEKVKVGKYFYDYEEESKKQEDSLLYYENTYMQNNGVDYISDEDFEVVSVLDGEIISIEENDIYGKIITIKHNDNLNTVYSNVKDVLVNVGYKTSQGEIIATSDTSKLDDSKKSTLHFEVYYKGNTIDPEEMYTLKVSDLN